MESEVFQHAVAGRDAPAGAVRTAAEPLCWEEPAQDTVPEPVPAEPTQPVTQEMPTELPQDASQDMSPEDPQTVAPDFRALPAQPAPMRQRRDPRNAQVRFLHAAGAGPLRLTLGSRLLTPRLLPGNLTGCFEVAPGFRALTVCDGENPLSLLYYGAVPFSPGERCTLAVVPSAAGLDLVRVDDGARHARFTDRACLRAVNLIYDSPALDVALTDGRVIFTDLRFKETTSFRRARAGEYDLYIGQTPFPLPGLWGDVETAADLSGAAERPLPGCAAEPLASLTLPARAGRNQTLYLLGDWRETPHARVRLVEDF